MSSEAHTAGKSWGYLEEIVGMRPVRVKGQLQHIVGAMRTAVGINFISILINA